MNYKTLVSEEKVLSHVIDVTGCMSYAQAIMILSDYLDFTEARAEVSILRMIDLRKMFFTEDKKFLLRGNIRSAYKGKIDRNMIESLYVSLEYISKPEDLLYLYGVNELHFLAGNQNHTVVHCDSDLQKIIYWTNLYQDKRNKLRARAKAFTEDQVYSIYGKIVYVFSESINEEHTIQKIKDLKLDYPCDIIFIKNFSFIERPEYNIYEI